MLTAINAFVAHPTVEPTSALITGYDFLTDQANTINSTLTAFGIQSRDTLIDDTWTADQFCANFFGTSAAPGTQARGRTRLIRISPMIAFSRTFQVITCWPAR